MRESSLGKILSVQGPKALPVATTRGTPAAAAAETASSTFEVSSCFELGSVPSTSVKIRSIC